MDEKRKKFNAFVTNMGLSVPLDDKSLKVLYNEETSHIWEQLMEKLLPADVVRKRKDRIWAYQKEFGVLQSGASSELTEYELSLQLEQKNKEVRKLQDEVDDLKNGDLSATINLNNSKIKELESESSRLKNAVRVYSERIQETEANLKKMENYRSVLSKTACLLPKCNPDDYKVDYEKCVDDFSKEISAKYGRLKADRADGEADSSLGILNLSTMNDSDLNLSNFGSTSGKLTNTCATQEFPDSVLFRFLEKDASYTDDLHKMKNKRLEDTTFLELRSVLLQELLERRKYELQCCIVAKRCNISNVTCDLNFEVFEDAVAEELAELDNRISTTTTTTEANEVAGQLVAERLHRQDKLLSLKRLTVKLNETHQKIRGVNEKLHEMIAESPLRGMLKHQFAALNEEFADRYDDVLAAFLSDPVKSSRNMEMDLKSLYGANRAKDLAKYLPCNALTPHAILHEFHMKRNFVAMMDGFGDAKSKRFADASNKQINDDGGFAATMPKIVESYKKSLNKAERAAKCVDVAIRNYKLIKSLPLDRYLPEDELRKEYLVAYKNFADLLAQLEEE